MDLVVLDSQRKLAHLQQSDLTQQFTISYHTDFGSVRKTIEACDDPSQLILLLDVGLDNIEVIDFIKKILDANHFTKAVILSHYEKVEQSSLELEEMCEEFGIPLVSLESDFVEPQLIDKIQYVENLSKKLKSKNPFKEIRKNHRYYHAKNPGRMLQAARENLGIDIPTLVEYINKLEYTISIDRIQTIESDNLGDKINALEWYVLCKILELNACTLSTGIERAWHLRRCRHAIEKGEFQLPITETLKAKLAELEIIDKEEELFLEKQAITFASGNLKKIR